jgi:hypothetical protein
MFYGKKWPRSQVEYLLNVFYFAAMECRDSQTNLVIYLSGFSNIAFPMNSLISMQVEPDVEKAVHLTMRKTQSSPRAADITILIDMKNIYTVNSFRGYC